MIAPHLKHNLHHAPPNNNPDKPENQAQTHPETGNPNTPSAPPNPHPQPAYLPTTSNSPLLLNQPLYTRIQTAPRTLLHHATLPSRSGLALPLLAKTILRISTRHGAQVVDFNAFSTPNHAEHFWASRTRQLHSSHLTTFDRLWSNLPYMRPMLTIIADTLTPRLTFPTGFGGRCHDLLGTRCDPYINHLLSSSVSSPSSTAPQGQVNGGGQDFDFHCHSNLARAVLPFGIPESAVHDVLNLFQVTGLDAHGRYFMEPSPATTEDYIEFFVEQDVIVALSTCPGGDLSRWGFGPEGERAMRECCRAVEVEVFGLVEPDEVLKEWREPQSPRYRGLHGMRVPVGEWGGDVMTMATGMEEESGGREEGSGNQSELS